MRITKSKRVRPLDIISLQNLEGCGTVTTRKICEYITEHSYGVSSPAEMFYLWPQLAGVGIVKGKLSEQTEDAFIRAYQKAGTILSDSEQLGIGALSIYDDEYPEILMSTINEQGKEDAPLLLYYRGNLDILMKPAVAIVGTREPSSEGVEAGLYYGKEFAKNGFNVVSGLALGCDTAGHQGALEANGVTTAFLAHGLDTIYPPQNTKLAEEIINHGGLLLSEYPIGTQVTKYSLASRDRLQAGLSLATIVIQTGVKGGTMHAATTTLLSRKPLYVVKYSDMSKAQGNVKLKNEGGRYISSAEIDSISMSLLKNSSSNAAPHASDEQLSLFTDF